MIVTERPQACAVWTLIMILLGYVGFCAYVHLLSGVPISPKTPLVYALLVHWDLPDWFLLGFGLAIGLVVTAIVFNPFSAKDVYGGAHLATEAEIRKLGLRCKEGLILGRTVHKFCGLYCFCRYLRMDQPLSVLLFAPPGSGKTTGPIISSLLVLKNSVIVFDPKGEIYKRTARHRFEHKDLQSKIVRFAPGVSGSARWNPLSKKELPKSRQEVQTYVGRLAESLIVPDKPGEEDMWTRDARALFRFWALFLIWRDSGIRDEESGETSLGKMIREATGATCDKGPQGAIQQVFEEWGGDPAKGAMPLAIQTEGRNYVSMAEKQFDGVFGTFSSKMDLFKNETVAENLSSSDFCFKELREKLVSVYFVVAINDMELMRPLISLFFQVAANVFQSEMPKPEEHTVTLIMDEFVQMGKMPKVLDLPAVGRGFRANGVFVVQSFSQLIALYGQHASDAFKNTTSYHLAYTQNEPKVAKDISESIGKYTRTRTTRSDGNLIRRTSDSEEGIYLVKPQDVMSMPKGEILLMVQNHMETPIRAQAPLFYDDRTLRRFLKGAEALVRQTEDMELEDAFTDGSRQAEPYEIRWERDPDAKKPGEQAEAAEVEAAGARFEEDLADSIGMDGSDMSFLIPLSDPDEVKILRAEPQPQTAAAPRHEEDEGGGQGGGALYASLKAFNAGDFSGFNMHELAGDDPKEDAA